MRKGALKFISSLAVTLLVPQLVFGADSFKPIIHNHGKYITSAASGDHHLLYGHVPADVNRSIQKQAMAKDEVLKLSIVLSLNNEEQLNEQLVSMTNPLRPDYQQYLTQSQFMEQYSPTAEQVDSTKAYLESQGMHVESIAPNRLIIRASGSVEAIEKAFNTRIYYYTDKKGKTFYAPAYELQVDKNVPILSVLGLENRTKFHPFHHRIKATPGAGPLQGLTPAKIKAAYSLKSNLNGAGQTLALYQLDGYTLSDITTYEDTFNLPHVPLQNILVDGATGIPSNTSGPGEVTLDIELMVSVAQGASKILVYEGPPTAAGVIDTYNKIATDNLAKTISSSWGIAETQTSGSVEQAENSIFKQMVAQGQSIFAASGDAGAYGDGKTLTANDPASQPFVIGVGGTRLFTNPDDSYQRETTWASGTGPGNGGGGGGISSVWPIPSWQQGIITQASKGSTTMRNVPDVALDADGYNSGYAIYYQGAWTEFGGTSCAAPLWSAFLTLVNQDRSNNGQGPMGFFNPTLYALGQSANYASTFHDIADNSTNLFYPAVKGYDLATGWGTFIGDSLINYLAGGLPPAPGCIHSNPAVSVTPSSQQSTPGGVLTYTVKVTNNDTSACTASSFNLSAAVPNGFTDKLNPASLSLSPGNSGSTSIQVTSGANTAFGSYPFTVKAQNSGTSTYQGTGSGTYVVGQSQSKGTLTIDPPTATYKYNTGEYAKFKFTLMDGFSVVPNNRININISGPVSWSSYVSTNFDGSVQYYIYLNDSVSRGAYKVTATSQYNGNTVSAQASFVVQ